LYVTNKQYKDYIKYYGNKNYIINQKDLDSLNSEIEINYGSVKDFLKELKKTNAIIKNSHKTSRYFYSITASILQLNSFKTFIEEEIKKFRKIAEEDNKDQNNAVLDNSLLTYFRNYEYAYYVITGTAGTNFNSAITDELARFNSLGISQTSCRQLSSEYIDSRDNFGYYRDLLVDYMIEKEYITTI
jgi:hypothetical protein